MIILFLSLSIELTFYSIYNSSKKNKTIFFITCVDVGILAQATRGKAKNDEKRKSKKQEKKKNHKNREREKEVCKKAQPTEKVSDKIK